MHFLLRVPVIVTDRIWKSKYIFRVFIFLLLFVRTYLNHNLFMWNLWNFCWLWVYIPRNGCQYWSECRKKMAKKHHFSWRSYNWNFTAKYKCILVRITRVVVSYSRREEKCQPCRKVILSYVTQRSVVQRVEPPVTFLSISMTSEPAFWGQDFISKWQVSLVAILLSLFLRNDEFQDS